MRFGWMTRFGLSLALAGWGALLAGVAAGWLIAFWTGAATDRAAFGFGLIGPCLIGSGFAIAVLGALKDGFGALDRFFDAVLHRAQSNPEAVSAPKPEPLPIAPARQIVESGMLHGRLYAVYSDGSVEVETLLGRRSFTSIADAQSFVGA